ncbi:MAG: SMP-30/gluconolactonase/LRE family protein [Fibrobacter sp.]|nr:SMP-30/gluconolactonase/LRE family protein [Fibrobacter sp.]
MSSNTPKLVFYAQSTLLEGPAFSKELNSVLCVSIEQERIFLIDPDEQYVKTFKTRGQVGFAVFEDKDHIIYAAYEGVFRLCISTGEETFLYHLISDPQIRYNDGKKDPKGRLLLGTTGYKCFKEKQCALFSHDGNSAKVLVNGTSISNGIGFYKNYMFFIDTPTRKVGRYIYNEKGDATFDKYIVSIEGKGNPDGMDIDDQGNLYIAIWGGSRVEKYNQDGEKIGELQMPVLNVTSVCIVGEKLYVTTAMHDDGTQSEPMAGGLFVADKF